ncbi:ABC transporter ATP-binding protein [Pelagibacteraceae bacterium]|jgi:iron(III) transport system ATP-binding protein|nr:ABC transporter ATP-binding protein [Pelagibacteraceae bacterium]
MSINFFEINNATFVASKKNKVLDFNLTIKNEGEIICLLGPSGIGKTTILRSIAGLQKIPKGKIFLKGNILSSEEEHIEPEKRNVALSFQDNSLFPHYTILDNINFGAKRNRNAKYNFKINELIKVLHLEGLEKKYPHQISAGEAQRVSLARSLMSKPDLLLLDEPFSNVDESLKVELQQNIKKILKEKKITTIIVTHDSYEAFYMADFCGILLSQTMKQFDTPYNIYHYPNSIEVVNFLNRGILVDAKVINGNSVEHKCLGIIKGNFVKKYKEGTAVKLLVQPDDLEHDDKSKLQLEIIDKKFRGTNFIYTLKTKNDDLIPVFVHSHHIHQHEVEEKFGVKTPIYIDHLVCF